MAKKYAKNKEAKGKAIVVVIPDAPKPPLKPIPTAKPGTIARPFVVPLGQQRPGMGLEGATVINSASDADQYVQQHAMRRRNE